MRGPVSTVARSFVSFCRFLRKMLRITLVDPYVRFYSDFRGDHEMRQIRHYLMG